MGENVSEKFGYFLAILYLCIRFSKQENNSCRNRLLESVGQTTHVLLNMTTDYNARLLAKEITMFFNINPDAFEVLVFKGAKSILVKRKAATDKDFVKKFMFAYYK